PKNRPPLRRSWSPRPSAPVALTAVTGGGDMARPGLHNHPKFRRLCHELNLPIAHARGHLECMWDCAYECGDPHLGDTTDVELAAQWTGERGKLTEVLAKVRLIDDQGNGRYQIHDLFDHAPEYVQKRRQRELERQKMGKERLHKYAPRNRNQ